MHTVAEIIKRRGGLEALKRDSIRIENPPYMRLVIEHIGRGPRGHDLLSVAHYYEQNGDAMRDPEITFEVSPDLSIWSPISFLQDNLGIYREFYFTNDAGQMMQRTRQIKDAFDFSKLWDRNIKEQGFLRLADPDRAERLEREF
jgi:hypothetical protein